MCTDHGYSILTLGDDTVMCPEKKGGEGPGSFFHLRSYIVVLEHLKVQGFLAYHTKRLILPYLDNLPNQHPFKKTKGKFQPPRTLHQGTLLKCNEHS